MLFTSIVLTMLFYLTFKLSVENVPIAMLPKLSRLTIPGSGTDDERLAVVSKKESCRYAKRRNRETDKKAQLIDEGIGGVVKNYTDSVDATMGNYSLLEAAYSLLRRPTVRSMKKVKTKFKFKAKIKVP